MRRRLLGSVLLLGVFACGQFVKDPVEAPGLIAPHGGAQTTAQTSTVAETLVVASTGCAHDFQLRGTPGTVIPNAILSTVFWGGYWSGPGAAERQVYDQTWADVGNSPAFYARLAEYSTQTQAIVTGSWSGSTLTNKPLASGITITEDEIQAELASEIAAGTVPVLNVNRIYIVMLPPGVTSQFDSTNFFAGHHRQFTNAQGNIVRYAVITYNSDTQYNNPLISHEVSESITDPDLSTGWYDQNGDEVGDVCRFNYAMLDGFKIEKIFSQEQCACIGTVTQTSTDAGTDTGTDAGTIDTGTDAGVDTGTTTTCTAPEWKATDAYPGGSVVSFQGKQYTSAFWNRGDEPDLNFGPQFSGQPWGEPTSCGTTTCTPQCSGKQCGADGCGGVCGSCGTGETCNSGGQCISSCTPQCNGKQCGADGCGGVCGTCSTGQTCSSHGTCDTTTTVGCGRLPPWDSSKPWTAYKTGDLAVSNHHIYECVSVGYCYYDPAGPFGTFGWTDKGACP